MPIVPLGEFARHGRADHLDAAEFVVVLQLVADLGRRRSARRLAAVLRADADQHVARRAELLHLDFAEFELRQPCADVAEVGRPLLGWTSISEPPLKSMP